MATSQRDGPGLALTFLTSKVLLLLLGAALVTASIYLWKVQEAKDLAQLDADVAAKTRSYASETETRFDRIYGALTRLAARGAPRGAAAQGEWAKDAAFYIDTFSGITRLAWVDEAFRIQQVAPGAGNDTLIGALASTVAADPLEVNLWLPTYDEVDFQGFILATVRLDKLLAPIIEEIGSSYMLQLAREDEALYSSANWQAPLATLRAAQAIILKNSTVLELVLAPTTDLRAASTVVARNTLWFALLLSVLTVSAAAFAQNYLGKARSSELRYQNLFAASRDAIFVTDAAGRFQDANPAATALVGYALAELRQMAVSDLLAPAEAPGEELLRAWLTGVSAETHFRGKDGRTTPVELGTSAVAMRGQRQFVVAIVRDISERKRAEAELNDYHDHLEALVVERTRALQETNAELESFSFSVSHDLRTPLRHIEGFVGLLDRHLGAQVDATARHYLDQVIAASQHMGELIDGLLKFSRTSRAQMTFTVVDPNAVIAQVRDELQASSAGRQIVWQIAPLPPVMADAALLRVVWTNLIANAIKFTGPRTPAVIEIGAIPPRPDDGKVTFCIKDNGVGFDPTQASRLFGVFQRLHSDDEFEGSGIGLALVRRIIQRHDGEIWAEAVPDAGAIFYFTLKPAMIHGSEAHQDVASGVP